MRRRILALVGGLVFLSLGPAGAGPPQRIVSLAPSITETVFALGGGGSLVGVSDFCDWPPAARGLPRVGSYLKPNVEAVVASRPDLVIAVPSPGNHDEVDALIRFGLRVEVVAEGPTLDDVYESIATIGAAIGRSAEGRRQIAEMRSRIVAVRERVKQQPRRRVLFVVDRSPLVVAGDGTLLDELLRIAGAENLATGLGEWPRLSIERLVQQAPEIILDGAMGSAAKPDAAFYDGLGLTAVREGNVRSVRIDEIMRPGPRLPEGLEKLAREVHPEVFAREARGGEPPGEALP